MKEQYLYWKRYEEQLKGEIEAAEAALMINKVLLKTVRKELSKLPSPKAEGTA